MNSILRGTTSPAIGLLQQLETLLRDPVLGPPVATQVAATIDAVLQRHENGPVYPLDKNAYARLWNAADTELTERQATQALISLASI